MLAALIASYAALALRTEPRLAVDPPAGLVDSIVRVRFGTMRAFGDYWPRPRTFLAETLRRNARG